MLSFYKLTHKKAPKANSTLGAFLKDIFLSLVTTT